MLVCLILLLASLPALHAQPAPESNSEKAEAVEKQTPADVIAQADELVSQITSNPDADEATKAKAAELKVEIQKSLDVLQRDWDQMNKTRQAIKTTPTEAQKMKAEIEQLRNAPAKTWNPATPANELEQELATLQTRLEGLQKEVATLADQSTQRRQKIQESLDKLAAEESNLVNTLQATEASADATALEKLQRLSQQTLRVKIGQQIKALEAEMQELEARQTVGWNQIKTELTELQLVKLQEQVKNLTKVYQQARQVEAARAVREAEAQNKEIIENYPRLKDLVAQYQNWADENKGLIPQLTRAENDLIRLKAQRTERNQQYERVTTLVDQVGHTGPIGIMLRELQSELPNAEFYLEKLPERNKNLADVQLKIFELEGAQSQQIPPDQFINETMPEATEQEKKVALEAIRKQREMLKTFKHNNIQYHGTLYELSTTEKNIVEKLNEFNSYINERVLWIRSSEPLSLAELKADDESFNWLFSAESWKQVWTHSVNRIRSAHWESVLFVAFWSILLILGARWRRQLAEISKQVAPSAFYKFTPTVKATILTLLIAIVWPLFFWGWAWLLEEQVPLGDFSHTLVPTLNQVGNWFFALEFVRLLFRSRGLADSHFQWNFASMLTVRRNMRWLMAVSIPLLFLCGLLQGHTIDEEHDAWERVAYILFLLSLTVFLFNIFRPSTGLFQTIIDYKQNAWMDRLRGPVCLALVSIPIVLIAFSFLGYHYTARQLSGFLSTTAWFLMALFVVRALMLRWIMLGYRRLSIQRAQQKREQKEAEKQVTDQPEVPAAVAEAPIKLEEERPIDLRFSSHQIRRLLNATLWTVAFCGLWLIWFEMIPALSMLDSSEYLTVWHTTEQVTDPDTGNTVDVIEPVTFFDLALGLAVGVLTIAATRNIPGLLEMTILEKLPIDASVRYAVTTIARYVCILFGMIVGFQVIGLAWSQVQWMATALTFGLAFGLQEIFANFISGIILLFERPIRVGDIVTIDSVSGIVSRIRMRATTITDWDRKEYVVPNKEFITGRLLNWTLSDPVTRIVIEVGIAYGSDVEKARQIITDLVTNHSEVLEDPGPVVTFDGFGDSTLKLTARAYLPSLENRLMTIHQLHLQINNAFNEAGIEIAFPQRDLHIRSMPADFAKHLTAESKSHAGNGKESSHHGNGNGNGKQAEPKPPTEPAEALSNKPSSSGMMTDPDVDE